MKNFSDTKTTIHDLKAKILEFTQERDWAQFHTPKNLSMSIAIEAAELMEKFQFLTSEESKEIVKTNREEIQEELADVLTYVVSFANACNIDLAAAFEDKMHKNSKKYPAELCKGSYGKYTKLCKKAS